MNLFTEIQLQRANALLDSLNEDLKPKERYKPIGVFTEKGLTFISAEILTKIFYSMFWILTEIFQMDFQRTGEHFST